MSDTIAFIDFETTGLSADNGDRPTEVAIVLVESQRITDRFQSLINPGRRIPSDVVSLTGITDAMVSNAPSPSEVMRLVHGKIQSYPLVAHNASFDRKFFDAECQRISIRRRQDFYCSIRVARRVYREAPNYKLGTLVQLAQPQWPSQAHRALADAEMTAKLWISMEQRLQERYGIDEVPFGLMANLQSVRIASADDYIRRFVESKKVPKSRKPRKLSASGNSVAHPRGTVKPKPTSLGPAALASRSIPSSARITCITCHGSVTVQDTNWNKWVKCPHCGFNTPRNG